MFTYITTVCSHNYSTHTLTLYCAHHNTVTARHYSRGEGRVVLGPQVVRVQVEHADHEGHKHHDEDDHELEDVFDCPPQRDLQWAEALIGRQDVGDA